MPKILHSLLPKSLHFWSPFTVRDFNAILESLCIIRLSVTLRPEPSGRNHLVGNLSFCTYIRERDLPLQQSTIEYNGPITYAAPLNDKVQPLGMAMVLPFRSILDLIL